MQTCSWCRFRTFVHDVSRGISGHPRVTRTRGSVLAIQKEYLKKYLINKTIALSIYNIHFCVFLGLRLRTKVAFRHLEAVALWENFPANTPLDVGMHVTSVTGRPLTGLVPSITLSFVFIVCPQFWTNGSNKVSALPRTIILGFVTWILFFRIIRDLSDPVGWY